ncbi:MAG: translocation/assembly module TamB domain-containing protein, partial [Desulfamplus sp.]|nr:translocation/assembly module TamB domain-containing protein [Desulfamplus sp.]
MKNNRNLIVLKKIAITGGCIAGTLIILTLVCLSALFFYIHSDNFSKLIQSQINQKIPGKMEWEKLYFSMKTGEVTLDNYKLSLNEEVIASVEKVHIALDIANFVRSFDLSTIIDSSVFLTTKNSFGVSTMENLSDSKKFSDSSKKVKHELVINTILIEKPYINLVMQQDHRLNILSAFPVRKDEPESQEDKNINFKMPFDVAINDIKLNQGKFKYRSLEHKSENRASQNTQEKTDNVSESGNNVSGSGSNASGSDDNSSESSNLDILIEDINFKGSANLAEKSDLGFTLSMKSAGGDLAIGGTVKNILLEADPIFDLTCSSNLIMADLMDMLGVDEQTVSGNLSIRAALSGNLNDPSISCQISYPDGTIKQDETVRNNTHSVAKSVDEKKSDPKLLDSHNLNANNISNTKSKKTDGKIIGRIIKKAILDIVMDKRELTVNSLEIEHPDATLKATGQISLAQAFPDGFAKLEKKDIKKIRGKLYINGENIDAGRLLESESIKEVKGITSFKTEISGSLNNPEIGLTLKAENAGYLDYPVVDSASFDLALSDGVVNIKKIDLLSCDSSVILDGTIKVLEKENVSEKKRVSENEKSSEEDKIGGEDKVSGKEKGNIGDENLSEKKKANIKFKLMELPVFDISANSKKINLTEVLRQLNLLQDQNIKATLGAKSHLSGTLKNPKVVLNINGKNISAAGQDFETVNLKAGYENHKTVVDSLTVSLASDSGGNAGRQSSSDSKTRGNSGKGSSSDSKILSYRSNSSASDNTLELKGWIDQNQKMKFDLFCGGIDLSVIQSVKQSGVIQGIASCSVSAEGSLKSLESSTVKGDVALKRVKIIDKPFENFAAKVNFKNNLITVNGKLNFDIDANFNTKSKDFSVQAIFKRTDLTPWVTFAGIKQIQSGTVTGNIDIKGNVDHTEQISGNCNLSEISLNIFKDPRIFINDSDELWIRAKNMRVWIDGKKFRIDKFRTLLPEKGEVALAASGQIGGDIRAQADATLPVKFASLFLADMPLMKGSVKLNVMADLKSDTDLTNSNMDAKLELVGIDVMLPDLAGNVKIHDINGTIIADINKIEIPQITGLITSGLNQSVSKSAVQGSKVIAKSSGKKSGQFKLSGQSKLIDFIPHDIQAKLTAKDISLNMIEDLSAGFDTDLSFKGNPEASTLSGNVLITHAQWTRDIHVEKNIFSSLTDKKRVRKEVPQKKESNRFLENMKLNIAVKGKKPIIVDNNLAYMEIRPDIRVRGTASSPVVSGRSEINPGTITYQSTEFTLTRGIIYFINPYKIEPDLDIESHRKIRNWDILLAVSGTPQNLKFKLTSDPRLEDGDIISLLLRGKTVTELISSEGGTTFSAAGMLSQVASSAVSDRVKSATGLDIFELGFGNNTNDNGLGDMNLTVGKEITDKITVKYGTETKDGVMVGKTSAEYKVMDNVSLSGFQNS